MSSRFTDSPTLSHEHGTSRPQKTAVGSGSRPSKSRVPIMTSAPKSPQTLSRGTSGALKQG